MTGTARQEVVNDYERMIEEGTTALSTLIKDTLPLILSNASSSFLPQFSTSTQFLNPFPSSVVVAIVENHLGWNVNTPLHFSTSEPSLKVTDHAGNVIASQISKSYNFSTNGNLYDLHFFPNLPPLSYSTFFISRSAKSKHKVSESASLENEFLRLDFDPSTGLMSHLTNKLIAKTISFHQNFKKYGSSLGSAYIFRPNVEYDVAEKCSLSFDQGPLVKRATQVFGASISQTITLYAGQAYLEVTQHVQMDDVERDLVSVFNTNMSSGDSFYTDDSGMQIKQRKWLENSFVVEGNYYPVVSTMFLLDHSQNTQLAFLTAHSHGGTSRGNGQVELMLHRRMDKLGFPSLGLGQPLNDTTAINDTMWIMFGDYDTVNRERHRKVLELNNKPHAFFSSTNSTQFWNSNIKSSPISFLKSNPPQKLSLSHSLPFF